MSSDLRSIVDHSTRIVFFGGAGVSTESGIPGRPAPLPTSAQRRPANADSCLLYTSDAADA